MGFSTVPCNEFVEVLGSKAPVPGGGGACTGWRCRHSAWQHGWCADSR